MHQLKLISFLVLSSNAAQNLEIVQGETKAMPCFGSTTDVSKCLFDGDHCSFVDNFDTPLSTIMYDPKYNGNLSTNYITEAGIPKIVDNKLVCPLIRQPGQIQAQATIMSTTRFLQFGSFEARLKTGRGNGVVSTFISISNDFEEIDFEFPNGVKGKESRVEANWYFRGQIPPKDAKIMGFDATDVSPGGAFDEMHTYRVDWTPEHIKWSVDGRVFNSLEKAAMGEDSYRFPTKPARISFGIWHAVNNVWAGDGKGEITWPADGEIATKFEYIKVMGLNCAGGVLGDSSSSKNKPENNNVGQPSGVISNTTDSNSTSAEPTKGKDNAASVLAPWGFFVVMVMLLF